MQQRGEPKKAFLVLIDAEDLPLSLGPQCGQRRCPWLGRFHRL